MIGWLHDIRGLEKAADLIWGELYLVNRRAGIPSNLIGYDLAKEEEKSNSSLWCQH